MTEASSLPTAIGRGLACRCPNCGKGPLFQGLLKIQPRCEACGFDLAKADTGDGPAVFVILGVGTVSCFGLLFTELAFSLPIWLELAIWLPITAMLCVGGLRPLKSLLVSLQVHNRASEARYED